jgi:hypothetical protein
MRTPHQGGAALAKSNGLNTFDRSLRQTKKSTYRKDCAAFDYGRSETMLTPRQVLHGDCSPEIELSVLANVDDLDDMTAFDLYIGYDGSGENDLNSVNVDQLFARIAEWRHEFGMTLAPVQLPSRLAALAIKGRLF